MKTIKTLLAVSVLTAVASADATTWDVTMNAQNYVPGVNGDLILENFVGTWDDVTGLGSWSGHLLSQASSLTTSFGVIPSDLSYTQTFFMPTTLGTDQWGYTSQGTLNPFDIPTCIDHLNTEWACTGFSGALSGEFYNTLPGDNAGYYSLPDQLAFTPVAGITYKWILPGKYNDRPPYFRPQIMNVMLHAQNAPSVPLPSTALLLGSGLVGLVGTAARRRKSV
ncbi:MAG: PEP-CTERM sorting domain-containing protein [Spongiibacteraceae bacterium]